MNQSSSDNDSSAGFPWFEERNYPGWLIQFKAHLRKTGSHFVLDNPRPDDLDANGVPQVLTNQQRRALETQQSEYDKADNIAYSELMKALRLNPKTKNLSETGVFNAQRSNCSPDYDSVITQSTKWLRHLTFFALSLPQATGIRNRC